jgi:hypothetical protein
VAARLQIVAVAILHKRRRGETKTIVAGGLGDLRSQVTSSQIQVENAQKKPPSFRPYRRVITKPR